MGIILTVYLVIVSVMDVMKKRISVGILFFGGVLSLALGILRMDGTNLPPGILLQGMLPGIIWMLFSFVTTMVGYGDGVIVCCLGLAMGLHRCLLVLGLGLFLLSIVSILLLIGKKVKATGTVPFLPFLMIAFLLIGE